VKQSKRNIRNAMKAQLQRKSKTPPSSKYAAKIRAEQEAQKSAASDKRPRF
jgi:hypothetical protein